MISMLTEVPRLTDITTQTIILKEIYSLFFKVYRPQKVRDQKHPVLLLLTDFRTINEYNAGR